MNISSAAGYLGGREHVLASKFLYPAVLVLTFAVFIFLNLTFLDKHYRPNVQEAKITVTRGDNLRTIADKLASADVILNQNFFIIAGKVMGYERSIIPGEYKFGNGLTNLDILKMMSNPFIERGYSVTIPEGLNVRQAARLLSRQIGIDSARYVSETRNDSLIKILGINAESLEGFLFPDTYRFNFSPSAEREKEMVRTLFNQFRKKITPEMYAVMKSKKINLKDVITMASIVGGETRYVPEMKTIAGVYYNRLKNNMRLEADPTVQYAIPDGPKKRLTYSDLRFPSPYNTYLRRGLPPGPINSPGMDAIMAALYPENHKSLYFVAKGDGSHVFAETYEEHKKNVERYRKYMMELQKAKEDSLARKNLK